MTNPPRQHYDDGLIQLDRRALTLRRYHFPSGTSKVIPLRSIRGYRAEPLGWWMHRFRIWGSSDLRRWLPLDVHRPLRSTLVTLDLPGSRPSPAFTPEDPETFLDLFDALLDALSTAPTDAPTDAPVDAPVDARTNAPADARDDGVSRR